MSSSRDNLDDALPRRGFLKLAIGAFNALIGLALAIPGLGYLLTPVFRKGASAWVQLGDVERLKTPVPQKASFRYISETGYTRSQKSGFVWVVEDAEAAYGVTALSAVCSHTGCNVAWHFDEAHFVCPCHGGRYDIRGNVVSGPPPKPLQKLPLRVENGRAAVQLTPNE